MRWSCPESLKEGVYTKASDVWAFGVLLWEMVTLGDNPFSNMSNKECYQYLMAGGRLKLPGDLCLSVTTVMERCWNENRIERPHFSEIATVLQDLELQEMKAPSPDIVRTSPARAHSTSYLQPPNLVVHPYEMPPPLPLPHLS